MKRISLTQNKYALIDNENYQYLSQWKWYTLKVNRTFYACRKETLTRKPIFMHTEIFGEHCDHKNRNGLDNRKANLRKATRSQQGMNRRLQSNNTSGFKGVQWCKRNGKWLARIGINNKKLDLGYFNSKEAAAKAYDQAALKYFGEFAVLNLS
jgi:hypothetical protein